MQITYKCYVHVHVITMSRTFQINFAVANVPMCESAYILKIDRISWQNQWLLLIFALTVLMFRGIN